MSHIDDLLAEMCPHGVDTRPLGDIAQLVRGNGMPRSDFTEGGVGCIHYGQIYMHYGTWATETLTHVSPETAMKLAKVDPGDVVITNTSENLDDVCKAVAWLGKDRIVTGGHATVIKHHQDAKYLSYWFQTPSFFDQKRKLATGTKVIDVSATLLGRVEVPVPPLSVQHEIVRILDTFAEVEAELEAELMEELQARSRQYVYYRDALCALPNAPRFHLGEVGSIFGGLSGKSKGDFSGGNARYISYMNVMNNIAVDLGRDDRVTILPGERQRSLSHGDVLLTGSSETAEDVAMSSVITDPIAGPLYLNSFCIGYRFHDSTVFDPDFAKHLFRSTPVRRELVKTASGVTRFNVSKARLAQVGIPVPGLSEQRRIAETLDDMNSLVRDLSVGLPAELVARRRQYQHYRDRLLTFEKAS